MCRSLSGLDVPVLSFGSGPKTVVILGRVHPGEANASWVVHGLLNFMASGSTVTLAMKELLTIKVVPMINCDGVFGGNYRTSYLGKDLNRLYLE